MTTQHGIPNKLAFQFEHKEETLSVVENYPFQLVEGYQDLGFTCCVLTS